MSLVPAGLLSSQQISWGSTRRFLHTKWRLFARSSQRVTLMMMILTSTTHLTPKKTVREKNISCNQFSLHLFLHYSDSYTEAVVLVGVQSKLMSIYKLHGRAWLFYSEHNGHITPFSGDREKSASLTFQDVAPFSLRAKKTVSTARYSQPAWYLWQSACMQM